MITVLLVLALGTLVLLGLAFTSCTNVQAFIWPVSVRCDGKPPAALTTAVDDVLRRDGLAAAFSDESIERLEDIAREVGGEPVVCALTQLRDIYAGPPGEVPTATHVARIARVHGFLDSRHIAIVKVQP